jgi:PLP dependent protein
MTSQSERLQSIQARLSRAARLSGRSAEAVTLIAVSKTRSASDIEALIDAGQRDFGESRVQEAIEKGWPGLKQRHSVRLHCIGRLQSNKAAEAVGLFDVIHSVDRLSLLDALARESARASRYPDVYVQVNIGEEDQKGGCAIADLGAIIAAVRGSPMKLAGLMAIPPLEVEPSPFFALLAKLARRHAVTGLSMGMSSDFEAAAMLGATAVRVGSALFEE